MHVLWRTGLLVVYKCQPYVEPVSFLCFTYVEPVSQPGKHIVKNLFLDALGEPQGSPRRTATSGLQASYKLNGGSGQSDQDIQVILLDERYYRETLPCSVRNDWWVDLYHTCS